MVVVTILTLLAGQTVLAGTGTPAAWGNSVDATFDTSSFDTILSLKDELNQGGMNLSTGKLTNEQTEADVVFNTYGSMGAGSLKDLGKVDFDSVNEIPDSGYTTYADATPGHVYIVSTHDGKFAKILVKQVLADKVLIRYALLSDSNSTNTNSNGQEMKEYVFEEGGVALTWGAYLGAAGYDLYRADSENGGTYEKLTDFPLTEPTFTDKYGLSGHIYFYKYVVYDRSGKILGESKPIKVKIVAKGTLNDQTAKSSIILHVGQKSATVNGVDKTLDVAPVIVDGRTLVPLRFIAEALGAKVEWDGGEQRIYADIEWGNGHSLGEQFRSQSKRKDGLYGCSCQN